VEIQEERNDHDRHDRWSPLHHPTRNRSIQRASGVWRVRRRRTTQTRKEQDSRLNKKKTRHPSVGHRVIRNNSMNTSKSNALPKLGFKSHHLDLPKFGRITCTVEETPTAFTLSCDFPATPRPRHQRVVDRWMEGVIEALKSDPRPLVMKVTMAGKTVCRGTSDGDNVAIIGGLVS